MNFLRKVFQSLEDKVAKMNDLEELAKLWKGKSEDSKKRGIIEVRITELLFKIDDPKALFEIGVSNRANIGIVSLVDQRMAEVFAKILPQIDDIAKLGDFVGLCVKGGKAGAELDKRILKVLSKILPQMDDPVEVLGLVVHAAIVSKSIRLIEARVSELASALYGQKEDIAVLWDFVNNKHPDHPIFTNCMDARIREILSEELPQITDITELLKYWRASPPRRAVSEIIDSKAVELISEWISQQKMDTFHLKELSAHYNNMPLDTEASRLLALCMFEAVIRGQSKELLSNCMGLLSHYSEDHRRMIYQAFEKVINTLSSKEEFVNIGFFAEEAFPSDSNVVQRVKGLCDIAVLNAGGW